MIDLGITWQDTIIYEDSDWLVTHLIFGRARLTGIGPETSGKTY